MDRRFRLAVGALLTKSLGDEHENRQECPRHASIAEAHAGQRHSCVSSDRFYDRDGPAPQSEASKPRTETTLHDLGEMVAANPLVIQAFKEDQSSEELILYLDNLIKGLRDVDVITLADMRLRRLYHVNRSRIGENSSVVTKSGC